MTADLSCPHCGNPSRDGGLCDNDESRLATVLAEAPGLLGDLQDTACKLKGGGNRLGAAKGADNPLPLDLHAANLRGGLELLLVSWALAVGSDADSAPTEAIPAAKWLAERIYDLRLHPAANDIVGELCTHARKCWRAVDSYGADLIWIGACTAPLPPNDVECRTSLTVRRGRDTATCWRCEATYDVQTMLEARDAIIGEHRMTAAAIGKLGWRTADNRLIGQRLIGSWVASGKLEPTGTKPNPGARRDARLYRLGDVKKAANSIRGAIGGAAAVDRRSA